NPSVMEASVPVTELMGGRGRVLLRKSGTEPYVPVIVEGDEEASGRAHAEQLSLIVSEVCG
ncbi:phosphoglucosamine mutase, partial [Pseudomonas aeruginosa]